MHWRRRHLALIQTRLSFHWCPRTDLQFPSFFRNLAVRLSCLWIWSLSDTRWAWVLTTLLMVLWWALAEAVHVNIGRCLKLVHSASDSTFLPLTIPLSAISLKNSPLFDLILTKRVKRLRSILTLSSSRIFRRMSPSGDSLMVGLIPSPIHFWIAIRKHLESVNSISGLWLLAYVIASSRVMHATVCSALLEDEPSSLIESEDVTRY